MTGLSEDELIATLFAPLAGPGGLQLRDDAALLGIAADQELVVTVDAIVAGVHCFPDDPPESIARKVLGVNLSDLAAKAALPAGFVLTLALPPGVNSDWLTEFATALGTEALRHGCPLLGGDTVRTSGPLTLSVTAFGTVPRGGMVLRTGALPGDAIFVSGTIGDAALGLQLRLEAGTKPAASGMPGLPPRLQAFLHDRYLHPRPRLGLREALRAYAHAGMDVSDGLVGDLRKMLRASGVSGRIDLSHVPFSEAARAVLDAGPDAFTVAVTGGDDYEVLACVPAAEADAFARLATRAGISVTRIGEVLAGKAPPLFVDTDGQPVLFSKGSFSHF